ncbi:phage tail tape measure protein [Phocaeicola plebeius]|jgi:TP901 family phage tail tape measure protein|uniref:phage tail tape measure protein n=1 Tax=Phocaeicola plebeius TaxID=310297 RepID=UPI0026EE6558|nr:phage tail tape measure protein [Phocaeicola plebeius]
MSNIFTRLLLNADGFNKNLYQAQKNLKGFAATSKGVFSGLTTFTSYAAAFVGISTSIHSAVTANMEFEKSLSSLRSLTGVSAQELNYFRTEAIRMGMDSTQSASQMVDAFKLIGSQMPELLKNKTALTQTAEAAVVLAEAAELDVPTAAKALTGALNQMGASSSEAANYINILAAASQQGSADIPYLNKAIENAGGAASSTGVKFNELVAIIEAIAPKITDAASAGTNLRNIFLTLESSADQNLRPSVVGLSTAIDNLSKMNLNAVQLTKMFGKESVTAAIAILQEKDAFDELSQSIKDTNTAYDQAAINNDNLSGSIGKLQSSWTSFINTMAGSNGYLKNAVDNLRDAVNWATRALAMTDEQKLKYDNRDNVSNAVKTMDLYVGQGMTPELAYQKTMADYTRTLFPDAQFVEKYRKEYEFAKAQTLNSGFGGKETKRIKQAKELYEIASKQKEVYELINAELKNHVESIKQQSEAAKKAKEESEAAAKAAKEKAAAEEAARLAKEKASRPDGSIADVEYQISQKKKEISVAISDNDRIRLSTELDELISKKREMELVVKFKNLTAPEEVKKSSSSLASMARLPDGWNKISQTNWNDKGVKEQISTINEYENAILSVESALSSLSGTFDNGSQSALSYFTNIIQGAAQAVTAIMALIPVKKAEANANAEAAVTGAASSVAPIPFVGAAMAVAAVTALIASMAAIPKFAKGGIVGGNSYFGDKLLARVNSGELILNQKQQAKLYHMAEDDRSGIAISFDRVRGSDIYLALRNYMKDTGKKL